MTIFHLRSRSLSNKVAALLLGILFANTVAIKTANADAVLSTIKEPIYLQPQSTIDVHSTPVGFPFQAKTLENYSFGTATIPSNTLFRGHIHAVHESRRFDRPGFVQLDIEEVQFPSGNRVYFVSETPNPQQKWRARHSSTNGPLRTAKLMHPEAVPLQNQIGSGLLFFSGSTLLVDVPVVVATSLPFYVIGGIGLAVRSIEGVMSEHTPREKAWHTAKDEGWKKRYEHGILRGIGVVGMYSLFKLPPNPTYSETTVFPVTLKKAAMLQLFNAAHNEQVSSISVPKTLP